MSLLRYEENAKVQSLARPVFDSVTDLMSIHLEERGGELEWGEKVYRQPFEPSTFEENEHHDSSLWCR